MTPPLSQQTDDLRDEIWRLTVENERLRASLAKSGPGNLARHDDAAKLRTALEEIAQYNGADWDVEGVCGHAVDALAETGLEKPHG